MTKRSLHYNFGVQNVHWNNFVFYFFKNNFFLLLSFSIVNRKFIVGWNQRIGPTTWPAFYYSAIIYRRNCHPPFACLTIPTRRFYRSYYKSIRYNIVKPNDSKFVFRTVRSENDLKMYCLFTSEHVFFACCWPVINLSTGFVFVMADAKVRIKCFVSYTSYF